MTDTTATAGRSRKAVAAKIAGIIGVVICIAIILGVWFGRGQIAGSMRDLNETVSGGFDRAIAASTAVSDRLSEVATNVGSIGSDATDVESGGSSRPEVLARLQARLGDLSDRYRELRERYAEVRENLTSVLATLQNLGRFLPGTIVPQEATDALQGIDDRLQAVDEAITSAWAALRDGVTTGIADRVAAIEAAISGAASRVDGLSSRLETAKAKAQGTLNGIDTLLLVAAFAISILLIWVLLLNIALWVLGRAWQREHESGGWAAQTPPSDEGESEAVAEAPAST